MKVVIDQVAAEVSQLSGEKLEYLVGTMIELPRAALRAGEIAEIGRVLQLRHQRPDADDVRPQPRRFGVVPGEVPAARHPRARSLRLARHRGRGRADRDRLRARPQGAARTSSSASAASMAAIRPRCSSATRPASTTSPARPTACRSRGSPPRRPRWAARSRRNAPFPPWGGGRGAGGGPPAPARGRGPGRGPRGRGGGGRGPPRGLLGGPPGAGRGPSFRAARGRGGGGGGGGGGVGVLSFLPPGGGGAVWWWGARVPCRPRRGGVCVRSLGGAATGWAGSPIRRLPPWC